ncbi:MAG: hypothetical protein NT138_06815 [Planctomycetales bacterium]|nr:hypothetical protein [Planctomycetales bacterium]
MSQSPEVIDAGIHSMFRVQSLMIVDMEVEAPAEPLHCGKTPAFQRFCDLPKPATLPTCLREANITIAKESFR